MNRYAFSLLCAAVLAVLGVRPAAAQALLQQCDKAMAEADSMAQQVGACASALEDARKAVKAAALEAALAPKTTVSAVKPPFVPASSAPRVARATMTSVETLYVMKAVEVATTTKWVALSTAAIPVDVTDAAMAEPVFWRLLHYYAFSAYTTGDLKVCEPMAFLEKEDECRDIVHDLAFARAQMGTSAEFLSACRQMNQWTDDPKKKAQCCALGVENKDLPNPCAKLVPSCIPDRRTCQAFFGSIAGDVLACQKLQPGKTPECVDAAGCQKERSECQDVAVFVKAFKAQDPALCGTSDRCRVLMGAGRQVVERRADELLKTPAGRWFMKREWTNLSRKRVVEIQAVRTPSGTRTISVPVPPAPDVPVPVVPVPVIPPPVVAVPPVTPTMVVPKFVSTIQGFSCVEPLGSEANRKAVLAVLSAAASCLTDIEIVIPRVDLATAAGVDERLEKLARLNLRLNALFDGPAVKAPPKPAVKRR